MWRDPGAWIAIGVSLLFLVVALVMHRVIVKVLKNGSTEPSDHE
ncbi:hypothetical protein [Candidatus Skiveiella danica]|jgi:hypothetical protein|nr:MAG: hypothetical protein BWX79_01922 [Alphaproteobacteria bacterium ADurb.Bin100]HPL77673.1 hypothetical protein [Burkholderiaceae bacterium]